MTSAIAIAFSAQAQTTPENTVAPQDEIIVTGTRAQGITAAESAAPIKILGAAALASVGQPNLSQALNQLVPSFAAEPHGADAGNLTLSARLRSLSPNHSLVLVNGKRRHPSANFHVIAGPYQGGAAPDLDLIPAGAIGRIEILEDGAAAQYGSDAIAGVINIILKQDEGLSGDLTAGQYFKGDGETYAASATIGTKLGDAGFANVTLFHRYRGHSQRGGADARFSNEDGSIRSTLSPAVQAAILANPDYPRINHTRGDAKSRLSTVFFNAGYDFGGVELYGFGSYGRRKAESFQNYRAPDVIVGSGTPGIPGGFGTPGAVVFAPNGFSPKQTLDEDDYSITAGIKGDGDWRWDLSTTYGYDKLRLGLIDSGNYSLFVDTGFTPTTFANGGFVSTEWTSNLDISRELEVGMAGPMTLSFGAEYRQNSYRIVQGDPASIYKEGGQGFPGFQPQDAERHKRDSVAGYIDLALNPADGLKVDVAGRYEHFSDFGDNLSGKLTARYDFSPAFALRGTISTGFRAPTLPEQFYSATNVSPFFATVQIPANSDAAKLLGINDLDPEKSVNLSLGAVIRPAPDLTITVDAYQINIDDRIVGTSLIYGVGGAVNSQLVLDAIALRGTVLDPNIFFVGATAITNGLDTRTRGIDVVASYNTPVGDGRIDWTLAANYNKNKVTRIGASPAQLAPQSLFQDYTILFIESGAPKLKAVASATYTLDRLSMMLRATLHGNTKSRLSVSGAEYVNHNTGTAVIFDAELGYRLTDSVRFSIGANNVLNKKAAITKEDSTGIPSDGLYIYNSPLTNSPYGFNGGFYYGRLSFDF